MSNDKMREDFESIWGFTNEEQECYFIPELNMYGSARVNRAAESKSTAWAYFQKGWRASHEALVIELSPYIAYDRELCIESIEAAGVKVSQCAAQIRHNCARRLMLKVQCTYT